MEKWKGLLTGNWKGPYVSKRRYTYVSTRHFNKGQKKQLQGQIKIIRQNFKRLPLPQTRATNKATPTTWDQ